MKMPPVIPRELDLHFDNDGEFLVIAGGAVRDLGADPLRWRRAVTRGHLLPLSIPDTSYTVVRVAIGALDPRLAAASIATARHSLEVTAGALVLTGSRELIEHLADRVRTFTIALPSGRYRVDVHLLATSASGSRFLTAAVGKPGAWWDATRPGEPRPAWLVDQLLSSRDSEGETERPGRGRDEVRRVEVVVHVEPLTGEPPPRQALDLTQGDFLLLTGFVTRVPARCPDAIAATLIDRVDEVPESKARAAATRALIAALDVGSPAELAAEAVEDEILAEAQRAHATRMAALRAEMKGRGDAVRARKAIAVAARRALPAVGSVTVWRCDFALEKPEHVADLEAADGAAAQRGLVATTDLLLGVDGDEDLWVRVYAAVGGDTYALYGIGMLASLAQGFEVLTAFADGRVLVTTFSADEGQALPGLTVACYPDVRRDDLGGLWDRHHDRRATLAAGPARAVVTDVEALAGLLARPLVRDLMCSDEDAEAVPRPATPKGKIKKPKPRAKATPATATKRRRK